jgi:hypothetical protein
MQSSGKLVILGILAVAVASAAASWWFRYEATHRAADFWGPDAAVLIRDAPGVLLIELRQLTALEANGPPSRSFAVGQDTYVAALERDISQARGLLHLRNALLEDRSYAWDDPQLPWRDEIEWKWRLVFFGDRPPKEIWFSSNARYAMREDGAVISCSPIASGLVAFLQDASSPDPPR